MGSNSKVIEVESAILQLRDRQFGDDDSEDLNDQVYALSLYEPMVRYDHEGGRESYWGMYPTAIAFFDNRGGYSSVEEMKDAYDEVVGVPFEDFNIYLNESMPPKRTWDESSEGALHNKYEYIFEEPIKVRIKEVRRRQDGKTMRYFREWVKE